MNGIIRALRKLDAVGLESFVSVFVVMGKFFHVSADSEIFACPYGVA